MSIRTVPIKPSRTENFPVLESDADEPRTHAWSLDVAGHPRSRTFGVAGVERGRETPDPSV